MIETELKPGDCLLYHPVPFSPSHFMGWLFGEAIARKTWHNISHVEVYAGKEQSVASRDGKGVDIYPFRSDQLAYILRPTQNFNFDEAFNWFLTVKGQGYDWKGLLRFVYTNEASTYSLAPQKMFCSEFATRFYRAGGLDLFGGEDADAIAPFQFLTSMGLVIIYQEGQHVVTASKNRD